jgi:hypothetical protein
MGPMCQACRLDRAIRKERLSKSEREKLANEWVEEINVQKYITNYSGEVFFGGARERDAELQQQQDDEEEEEEAVVEDTKSEGYEEDQCYESEEEDHQDPFDLIPKSFASDWDIHPDLSSASQRSSSSTMFSSRLSIRSDLSASLESWISDLFDRTLQGQMDNSIFFGGAEDAPTDVLCLLCREPLGDFDATYQHMLQCQYAHDERERMERLWRR